MPASRATACACATTSSALWKHCGDGIDRAHAQGKQFYVVSNISPHNAKLNTYLEDMAPVIALKPDALIMSDPGLIDMVREAWPEQAIHLSVQANTVNWAGRSLLEEVRALLASSCRANCRSTRWPKSASNARISSLKSSSMARCALPTPAVACSPATSTTATPTRAPAPTPAAGITRCIRRPNSPCSSSDRDAEILIEEKQRPGELMPIEEDEHGTYIMNSQGLARH